MKLALKTLLEGAIDYAGLFPPTSLDISVALAEYEAARQSSQAWIVSRFVVSSRQLPELAAVLTAKTISLLPLTVVGRGGATTAAWETGMAEDADALNVFIAAAGEQATIEGFETKLPNGAGLASAAASLAAFGETDTYAEIGWTDGLQDALAVCAEQEGLKAKARSGGTSAEAFPSSAEVASFIQGCCHLQLGFKFTAGLHQPGPTFDEDLQVRRHGFVNLFAATALALHHDLTQKEVGEAIDSPVSEFQFTDEAMTWKTLRVSLDEIAETRELIDPFGCCSIQEPLDGLTEAGWLGKVTR